MKCFDFCPSQLSLLWWWELGFFKILKFYNLLPVMCSVMLEPDLPSGMKNLFSSCWDFCQMKALSYQPFWGQAGGVPPTWGRGSWYPVPHQWMRGGRQLQGAPALLPQCPNPQLGATQKGYSCPKAPLGNRLRLQCNSSSPSIPSYSFSLPCPSLGVDPKNTP